MKETPLRCYKMQHQYKSFLIRLCLGLSLMLAMMVLPLAASAHPHVWITYTLKVVADKQGISKLRFTWLLDAMFTEMVKEDFHLKTIGTKDTNFIKNNAFANLKNYHYYLDIKTDGVAFIPQEVDDFLVNLRGDQLEYTFTVALPKPTQHLELALFDDSFYVDLSPPMQEIGGKDSKSLGSMMVEHHFEPKNFVFVGAESGGTPPTCSQRKTPHTSPIWGTFTVYTLTCNHGKS